MKLYLLLIAIFPVFLYSQNEGTLVKVGASIPDYTFNEILNADNKPFGLKEQNEPIIIEFWATWCNPCIPAMSKLEGFQKKFTDKIEIIAVSSDSKKNLNRYIQNTSTSLRIAFDTTHQHIFRYKYIPHIVLVDKYGIVRAITTPQKVTEKTITDLIDGKDIILDNTENSGDNNFDLYKEFENDAYKYVLSSENKNLSFKNEIKKDENNEPHALDFRNVSIIRLMVDIYELTSAARIYNAKEFISENKYCFKLEQKDAGSQELLENAREILNSNLDIQAKIVEKEVDSVLVLEVVDKEKLPELSTVKEKYFEFRGPYFLGKKITSYNLIEYLENEVNQPIKDKVKLDYPFDMELGWNYEEGGISLNRELEKYGLKISKSLKPEKIIMLELKKTAANRSASH
jgi:thiol-disulfide isomerase/thioredoxin